MRVSVKVFPNSSKSYVEGSRNGVLVVRVKAPPTEGQANKELISLLADFYSVSKNSICIISGANSKRKILEIIEE